MFVSPVMFNVSDDGGSGGGGENSDYLAATLASASLDEPAAVATEPVAEPAVPEDPFAQYGGQQSVTDAMAIAEALRTETGVKSMAVETLKALGYTAAEITNFLNRQDAEEQPMVSPDQAQFDGMGDDDLLTVAEARKLAQQMIDRTLSAKFQPWEERDEQERAQRAQTAVDGTLTELGVTDPDTAQSVLLEAQRFLAQDDWDPANIRSAIQRGHASFMVHLQKAHEAYLSGKASQAGALPTSVGGAGSTAGTPVEAEPRDLTEAMKRVRASLGAL